MATLTVKFNPASLAGIRNYLVNVGRGTARQFDRKARPLIERSLTKHAKREARALRRSGNLERGIEVGRGGAGPGVPAVSLKVKGPAAAYAKILNYGGVIRPRNVAHLTEPLKRAQDSKGNKLKSLREYPSKSTFTLNKPGPKFGKLANKKVVFLKSTEDRIVPLFVLTKEKRIKATRWAEKARDSMMDEVKPKLEEIARVLIDRRRAQGLRVR